jgi:hypothetical protein
VRVPFDDSNVFTKAQNLLKRLQLHAAGSFFIEDDEWLPTRLAISAKLRNTVLIEHEMDPALNKFLNLFCFLMERVIENLTVQFHFDATAIPGREEEEVTKRYIELWLYCTANPMIDPKITHLLEEQSRFRGASSAGSRGGDHSDVETGIVEADATGVQPFAELD